MLVHGHQNEIPTAFQHTFMNIYSYINVCVCEGEK